jgi:AmmeMemoRadiSam system protein B
VPPEVIRSPAVAGSFYPASPASLDALVKRLLAGAAAREPGPRPKALIVPHAGYVYSGPIAANAYALLAPHASSIRRFVVLGPAHRVPVAGVAAPGATRMRAPTGDLAVDVDAIVAVPTIGTSAAAHAQEHSIEVQLPFLIALAPHASVVPLAFGHGGSHEVAGVMRALWGGDETVVIVSSDLSHYLPYDVGREEDVRTAARIVALDESPLSGEQACGAAGITGLLAVARERRLRPVLVDLRSSGDTAGPREGVVGYGAFAFYDAEPS